MKALIQRVKRASVTIDGKLYSSINHGMLVLPQIQPYILAAVFEKPRFQCKIFVRIFALGYNESIHPCTCLAILVDCRYTRYT